MKGSHEPPTMFSIIVPTYNERENVKKLLNEIENLLEGEEFEIIVVDDNSPDNTADVVKSLEKRYDNLNLIVRKNKRGLSSAVIDGIRRSKYRKIIVMDADLQHPPSVIPRIVEELDKYDMVIASRYTAGGSVERWNIVRKLISKGANLFAHIMIPKVRKIKDPMSGFFGFWKDKVDIDKLDPIGYKIMLEILVKGNFKNVIEIPYTFRERFSGESKFKMKTMREYIKHVGTLSRYTGYFRTLFKFIAVGSSGILVNLGIFYLLLRIFDIYDLISVIIAIESSIVWNFTFNYLWTFKDRKSPENIFVKLGKFEMVSLGGLAINFLFYYILTRVFNILNLLAELIAIFIAFAFNFFLNDLWTWRWEK